MSATAVAVPAARAGRPPKEAGRLHLYLRADAKETMDRCGEIMDAGGPSEIVRVALRHYANFLTAKKNDRRVMITRKDGTEVEHATPPVRPDDARRARMHIHLSPTAEADLTACEEICGEGNASSVVAASIFTFEALLNEYRAGATVALVNKDGSRDGYAPWVELRGTGKRKN